MGSKKIFGSLTLLLVALIWGVAFVAQSSAMDSVGPWTFLAARSILGCVFLIPVIMIMSAVKKKNGAHQGEKTENGKTLLQGGIACGVALAVASGLQQIGIQYCDPGKAGFITAMYILLVPVFGVIVGKKLPLVMWICVALGVGGLYFLCVNSGSGIEKGDIYLLLCAVTFSMHILVISYFSPKADGVKMSCIQFFTVFVISGIVALIFEKPDMKTLGMAWLPICYAGIMSSGVGYTLQIVAQRYTDPTVASLLMSLESVFAVLAGIIILGEFPSGREWLGCAMMFVAIVVSQLPQKNTGKEKEK